MSLPGMGRCGQAWLSMAHKLLFCSLVSSCCRPIRSFSVASIGPSIKTRSTRETLSLVLSPRLCLRRQQSAAVSTILEGSGDETVTEGKDSLSYEGNKKLSRPERKALVRERKQRLAADGRSSSRASATTARRDVPPISVDAFTDQSTASFNVDGVISRIKKAQASLDVPTLRSIASLITSESTPIAAEQRVSLLSRLIVAALNIPKMDHVADMSMEARKKVMGELSILPEPMQSAAILRAYLRCGNETTAMSVLREELSVPDGLRDLSELNPDGYSPHAIECVQHRALSLASFASRCFAKGDIQHGFEMCNLLTELGPIVRACGLKASKLNMPWLAIMNAAARCESSRRDGSVSISEDSANLPCNVVYSVLDAMTTFPSDGNDNRVYEALSNALVRRILFVTGAVEMAGCPPPDRGEAVFIGRSNVGKSSLINMITNRKALAYTSKRPGKTQQFNFFAVNDKPGREKELKYGDKVEGTKDLDSFYLVDLPGFGFAKVPEAQRQQWASFMSNYLSERSTLRVVFHLVDGRHGPIDEDCAVMHRVGESLSKNVAYVVVLTKADKNVKRSSTKNQGKVSKEVMTSVREAMKEAKVGNSPVILTSSETKLGRDDLWRYLRLAAERSK